MVETALVARFSCRFTYSWVVSVWMKVRNDSFLEEAHGMSFSAWRTVGKVV